MLSDSDRKAIDNLRERLRRAILAGSTDSYLSCLTDDAVILHPDSPHVRGKEALASYLAAMVEAVTVVDLEFHPSIIEGDGELAYEVATQQCEVDSALPGFARDRQHLHMYRKKEGAWLLAAAMSGNR